MKNQMTITEKQQLVEFINENNETLTADQWMECGVYINLPGHTLYLGKDNDGWMVELKSDYCMVAILEEYNHENLEDLLDELNF